MEDSSNPKTFLAASWPLLTYRYVEHYFWVPQNIGLQSRVVAPPPSDVPLTKEARVVAVRRKIRSQEPPLNYLLNVFLHLSPKSVKRSLLSVFGLDSGSDVFADLELKHPEDISFVQPDVVLESSQARVFIEVKVGSRTGLDQVQKYCFLHAHRDEQSGQVKLPFLLFLTQKTFAAHWSPSSEAKGLGSVDAFLKEQLGEQPLSAKLTGRKSALAYRPAFADIVEKVGFGAATWQEFAQAVQGQRNARESASGEAAEMFATLAGDFLMDLKARGLWDGASAR